LSSRRSAVIVELHGRLGNQLFQFASGYAIARRHDAPLRFSSREVAPADLLLPALVGDAYTEATPAELLRVGRYAYDAPPRRVWASAAFSGARLARRIRGRRPPSVQYWHATSRFHADAFDVDPPVYVQGHLQSERYFAEYADEIVGALQWPATVPTLPAIEGPTVAVSFRRGDYNSLGWALPLRYYDDALELVAVRHPSATYVLFGDDHGFVELISDRVAAWGPTVDALELGTDPIAQLHLMSQCDHCVLANSSFAWWGAWLGDQRNADAARTVVVPAEYGLPDRAPSRWDAIPGGIPPT
jgi:hypothetical protein